jgi:hypothetical protein
MFERRVTLQTQPGPPSGDAGGEAGRICLVSPGNPLPEVVATAADFTLGLSVGA